MATLGGGCKGATGETPDPNVMDLMSKLNLMEEEGVVVNFNEDEDDTYLAAVEWAVVGKVLSPMSVYVKTVRAAMKPAWGNVVGLKFRAIREKGGNMFVVEFAGKMEMDRVLLGTPWMVGRHVVILKPYDEPLNASKITFDHMEIWVRILDLPLGWMNQ